MKAFIDILAAEAKTLSFEESQYADNYSNKFIDKERKRETLAARYLLDQLCKEHTGKSFHALRFLKTKKGKPFFAEDLSLFCSISHANGMVLVGLASTNLGVDIEQLDRIHTNELALAFTPEEWLQVEKNPTSIIREFSFKESLSKFLGVGFTVEPQTLQKDKDLFYQSTIIKNSANDSFMVTTVNANFKDIQVRFFRE